MRSANVSSDTATAGLCGCVARDEQQDTRENKRVGPRARDARFPAAAERGRSSAAGGEARGQGRGRV